MMRPPPRRAVTAVILAGGRGRRMGREKSRLRWRGRSLLRRWQDALQTEASEVLLVQARPRQPGRRGPLLWDRRADQGPVAGLEAGLRRASRHWCLFVPVDSLPPRLSLVRQLARRGGAHLRRGRDALYLHALVPRPARRALENFLRDGGRSAANACARMGLQAVAVRPQAMPVSSLNTPEQWRALQRRRLR